MYYFPELNCTVTETVNHGILESIIAGKVSDQHRKSFSCICDKHGVREATIEIKKAVIMIGRLTIINN